VTNTRNYEVFTRKHVWKKMAAATQSAQPIYLPPNEPKHAEFGTWNLLMLSLQ